MVATRLETRGAWISFKKPILKALPVIDLDALGANQLDFLAREFDEVSAHELLPFAQMAGDSTRARIDAIWSEASGIGKIGPIRELLGREPVVGLKRI
jgi:hypothetical protein